MSITSRIADTFTDSLARLTGDEQNVVKTPAFDLQLYAGAVHLCIPSARPKKARLSSSRP